MIIKKYLSFINEKLGVPDKIIDSATGLYNEILLHFRDKSKEGLKPKESEYLVNLPILIEISDLKFQSVEFTVRLLTHESDENVEIISWGVAGMPDSTGDYKLIYDKSKVNDIKLFINLAITGDTEPSDIYDYIEKESTKTIGILSHELKHVYDKYMLGKILLEDLVDYGTWSQTRTGFRPIDEFIYFMYFMSSAESLVRPSEIAGQLVSLDITKDKFREFLLDSSTYKTLIEIKKFSYDGLKQDLLSDIKHVKGLFSDIENEEDSEVIDAALEISYLTIVKSQGGEMSKILRLNSPIKSEMSQDHEFFKKYLNKIAYNSKEEFFLYCEKKLNFESDKVIKKISKLYDLCRDKSVDPLMDKITKRVDGKCIVNPLLYDKLVLGSGPKYKYK